MATDTIGFAWHVHHDELVEWCYSYDQRLAVIDRKPAEEISLRKRLFQMVKGELPSAYTQAWATFNQAKAVYTQAWAPYDQALAVYDQAKTTYNRARATDQAWATFNQAWAVYYQAKAPYDQAIAAHDQAWATFNRAKADNMPALIALHAIECLDCPWNGTTIFAVAEGRTA